MFRTRVTKKLSAASVVFLVSLLAACGSVQETADLETHAKPEREVSPFSNDFAFVCDDVTLVGHEEGTLSITGFFDKQGDFVRDQFHWNITGTLRREATGEIVSYSAHYTDAYTASDGTLTFNGIPLKLRLPDGSVIVDAGRLVFDPDTEETFFLAGPHALRGNVAATICNALQ